MMLQHNLRTRKSITQWEMEAVKDTIEGAGLTDRELDTLKEISRRRSFESQRAVGWHCGFEDLVGFLEDLIRVEKAA